MLMATGNHKLYEHVQLILMKLSGVRPPQIPPVLQNEFSILIRMIHRVWKELQRLLDDENALQDKLAGRTVRKHSRNAPNVGFCFDHIAKLRGHPELCEYNWSIWESDNVAEKDTLFSRVCLVYDWDFVPTVVHRMAGPAKAAVEARQFAWLQSQNILDDHDWRPMTQAEAADHKNNLGKPGARLRPTRGNECRGHNFAAAQAMGAEAWESEVAEPVRALLHYDFALSTHCPVRDDEAGVDALLATATFHNLVHITELVAEQRRLYHTPPDAATVDSTSRKRSGKSRKRGGKSRKRQCVRT